MSLKNKLNRLKPHLTSGTQNTKRVPETDSFDIPFLDEWERVGVAPFYFDGQYCLVREVTYPFEYQHGHFKFKDLLEAVSLWKNDGTNHPLSSSGHKPEDLVFFDTETTGLGGGAGNTIFLLGHASVSGDSIKLKQHILPHPGAEVALYQSFLQNTDYRTLVTYNGKAFDWPQVKTRHTLVRDHVPKLPAFGHFDLYHAARRMWKHKIERMKLSVVEQEVLGFERKDDIPGYLAPMIYFDFLERKNPEGLIGVIKHNEEDILSLITLYIHLTFQLLGIDKKQTSRETFEAGRWFSYLGESEKAKAVFNGIAIEGNDLEGEAKHALAHEFKRKKDWERAIPLWQETAVIGNSQARLEACIELAKYYEHHEKDFGLALKYSQLAVKLTEEFGGTSKKDLLFKENLSKRISRISRKKFPGQAHHSPN